MCLRYTINKLNVGHLPYKSGFLEKKTKNRWREYKNDYSRILRQQETDYYVVSGDNVEDELDKIEQYILPANLTIIKSRRI